MSSPTNRPRFPNRNPLVIIACLGEHGKQKSSTNLGFQEINSGKCLQPPNITRYNTLHHPLVIITRLGEHAQHNPRMTLGFSDTWLEMPLPPLNSTRVNNLHQLYYAITVPRGLLIEKPLWVIRILCQNSHTSTSHSDVDIQNYATWKLI